MDNYEEFTDYENEDIFLIHLSIEDTEHEDVEVLVSDPNKTIRDTISSIVQVFTLPKTDGGGYPIEYILGRITEDGETEVLFPEDEEGLEMSLIEYGVQPGDMLQVHHVPIAGYGCPIPSKMIEDYSKSIMYSKFKSLIKKVVFIRKHL